MNKSTLYNEETNKFCFHYGAFDSAQQALEGTRADGCRSGAVRRPTATAVCPKIYGGWIQKLLLK